MEAPQNGTPNFGKPPNQLGLLHLLGRWMTEQTVYEIESAGALAQSQ